MSKAMASVRRPQPKLPTARPPENAAYQAATDWPATSAGRRAARQCRIASTSIRRPPKPELRLSRANYETEHNRRDRAAHGQCAGTNRSLADLYRRDLESFCTNPYRCLPVRRGGWRRRRSSPCCGIWRRWRLRWRHRYRIVEHHVRRLTAQAETELLQADGRGSCRPRSSRRSRQSGRPRARTKLRRSVADLR